MSHLLSYREQHHSLLFSDTTKGIFHIIYILFNPIFVYVAYYVFLTDWVQKTYGEDQQIHFIYEDRPTNDFNSLIRYIEGLCLSNDHT